MGIDMSQYAKVWHERKKYCTIGQIGQRCIVVNITDKGNDSYSLANSAVTTLFNLPVTSEKEVTVGNGTAELTIASSMPEKVSCSTLITLVILLFGAVPTTDLSIPSICGFIRQKEIPSSQILFSRMSVHILVWIQLR